MGPLGGFMIWNRGSERPTAGERAVRGEPFLSGMFTRGEVVYADCDGEAASHREPVAIFAGEVLPQYAGALDDAAVRALLDELAQEGRPTLGPIAGRLTRRPTPDRSEIRLSQRVIVGARGLAPGLRPVLVKGIQAALRAARTLP
jgi:hypothetical protein